MQADLGNAHNCARQFHRVYLLWEVSPVRFGLALGLQTPPSAHPIFMGRKDTCGRIREDVIVMTVSC